MNSISKLKVSVWIIVVLLFVIAVAFVVGLGLYVQRAIEPMPVAPSRTLLVASGNSPSKIAELLEKEGLILNAQIFVYYLKYKQQGSKFQAGSYELAPGMSIDAIIDTLNKGLIVKEQGIKVTVPEGYTVKQISDKMNQQFGVDPNVFLQAVEQYSGFTAHVYAQIPDHPQLRSRLEGYLFPETYEWKADIKVEDLSLIHI